ncbi:hypothetical protein [Konateibacter massiliensis]|uniref:hypothetical protein n=1 Tax=Konateibacter massiliensis TaxID=2002841 RepID=UPI0015D4A128|nr:hypothetical protein [Konateibacter massiliensis]
MNMDSKINNLLYLETIITNLIHREIEELLRGKESDSQKLKESIIYQIDDRLNTR